MHEISPRAYKAVGFDGSEAIIPKSQVFGLDVEVSKSDAWWIAAWILEQKSLQYSAKKVAWFDEKGNKMPYIYKEYHKADKKGIIDNYITELRR